MILSKSTVAGLIYTLYKNRYLDQNPNNRKYRLGYKLAERTGVLLQQFDLRQTAAPILEKLRDECQESVNLAIRDGNYVIYIERMHGMNALGMRTEIGKREWLHSTALGKALLAHLPEQAIHKFTMECEFNSVTPQAISPTSGIFSGYRCNPPTRLRRRRSGERARWSLCCCGDQRLPGRTDRCCEHLRAVAALTRRAARDVRS